MGRVLKLGTASTPPRSTSAKMHAVSVERSRVLLKNGIPAGLSGVEKRAAEAEYKIAEFRKQNGLL